MSKKKSTELIWERLKEQTQGTLLNRSRIVEVAVIIADEDGINNVTMRRIASEFDTGAMSLYRHVFSKNDLLDLMVDFVFGTIEFPGQTSKDWQTNLRAFAYQTRSTLKEHIWVVPLLTSRPTLGPNYLRWFEFALEAISGLDLEMKTMMQMIGTLTAFVTAFAQYELAEEENTRRTGLTEEDKRRFATPYVESIIVGGQYPNFARFFQEKIEFDPEENFAFGLKSLLDGFSKHIP